MQNVNEHLFDRDTPVGECERLSLLMEAICAGWITVTPPPLFGVLWPGGVIYGLCPQ